MEEGLQLCDSGMSSSSSHNNNKMKIAGPYPHDWKDWSGLPRNLLFDIMDRLTVIEDYVQFGAVCRSWRTIFVEEIPENTNKHCSQPFLFVKTRKQHDASRNRGKGRLYSLSTNRKCKNFLFDWPNNKSLQASSFGWLLSMEETCPSTFKVQLQNPFLSQDYIVDLPPIDREGAMNSHACILKTALSSDPSFSRCFVAVAITGLGLAFCKPGDSTWTPLWDWRNVPTFLRGSLMFHDVVFFNKTKQFYALRHNGQVVAINFDGEPTLIQVMTLVFRFGNKAYLVEDLSGDLLVVVSKFPRNGKYFNLKVFKLDLVQGKWTKVHNLDDCVLFMSNNGVIAKSLSDCPGCERNCIYTTEAVFWGPFSRLRLGIYNLKHHTIYARNIGFFYKYSGDFWLLSELIWLEPTLLRSANTSTKTNTHTRAAQSTGGTSRRFGTNFYRILGSVLLCSHSS